MLFFQTYFVVLSFDAIAGIMQARVTSSNFSNLPSSAYTKSDNQCSYDIFSFSCTSLIP